MGRRLPTQECRNRSQLTICAPRRYAYRYSTAPRSSINVALDEACETSLIDWGCAPLDIRIRSYTSHLANIDPHPLSTVEALRLSWQHEQRGDAEYSADGGDSCLREVEAFSYLRLFSTLVASARRCPARRRCQCKNCEFVIVTSLLPLTFAG